MLRGAPQKPALGESIPPTAYRNPPSSTEIENVLLFNLGLIIAWPLSILYHIVDNFQELVDSWDCALVTHIGFNMQLYILYILFIGPESDQCLLLSLREPVKNVLAEFVR